MVYHRVLIAVIKLMTMQLKHLITYQPHQVVLHDFRRRYRYQLFLRLAHLRFDLGELFWSERLASARVNRKLFGQLARSGQRLRGGCGPSRFGWRGLLGLAWNLMLA